MDGVRLFSTEGLAYADSVDEASGRYRGLKTVGQAVTPLMTGVVVKPEVASAQIPADEAARATTGERSATSVTSSSGPSNRPIPAASGINDPEKKLRRFYGSVNLDPIRVSRDVAKMAEEVIQHLTALDKANVTIRLELEANTPEGVPDNIF